MHSKEIEMDNVNRKVSTIKVPGEAIERTTLIDISAIAIPLKSKV